MEEIKFKIARYADEWEIELDSNKEYSQQMLLEEIDELLKLHGHPYLNEGDKITIKIERQ
jgi:hypothetical protein